MARQSPGWSMSPTNSIESEASGASFHSELLGKMVRPTGGGKYHEKPFYISMLNNSMAATT